MRREIIVVFSLISILFGFFFVTDNALAKGAPVFEYEYFVKDFQGNMNVREGDYDWKTDDDYYYKVFYTFPYLDQGLYYNGKLEIKFTGSEDSDYESRVYCNFQGLTSTNNWIDITPPNYADDDYKISTYYITDTQYKQIRLVMSIRESYKYLGTWARIYVDYVKTNVFAISADQDTADNILIETINARSSADAAKDSADTAASQASNAANQASIAASKATTAISELQNTTYGLSAIKTKLDSTYSKANTAASQASSAASGVWDSIEGKSAATLAKEARENTFYNGNSAAYWAYLASVNTGTDTIAPTIKKVQGQNGATCTTSSSFTVVISASDNGPDSNLRYRAICGSFDSGWKSGNKVTISGLTNGAKTAIVKVSDNPTSPDSGNIAQETFTFFKV